MKSYTSGTLTLAAMSCLALSLAGAGASAQTAPRPLLSEPGISPNGQEIAFVSGGDIWTVATAGGTARLLVSHPATESRPLYSPDGTKLAFISNRTGAGDIYVLTLASAELKRLTYDDAPDNLSGWSPDSQYLYFANGAQDVVAARNSDVMRIKVDGGPAIPVTSEKYLAEYFAVPSPNGMVAFNAGGFAAEQWWRKGHSHLDETEIWLLNNGAYTRLTEPGAKEVWPLWQADGKAIFYVSDRSGTQNLWQRDIASNSRPKQVTQFRDGRILWPSISTDGRTIAFERDFRVWKLDTRSGQASAIDISRQGIPAGPDTSRLSLNGQWQDMILSPDGKKLALVGHNEIFVSGRDAGDAIRISNTPGVDNQPAWSADSKRLVYTSDRNGLPQLFEYDVTAATDRQLTPGPDRSPLFSHDGKQLAFQRGENGLMVLNLETKAERQAFTFPNPMGGPQIAANTRVPFAWSPNDKWLATLASGVENAVNAHVIDASGSTPARQVTFLTNTGGGNLAWSPDGTSLLFLTLMRTEAPQLARVDLGSRAPQFRETQVLDLFKDTPARAPATNGAATTDTAKAPPAAELEFTDLRERLTLTNPGIFASALRLTPDGKTALLLTASNPANGNTPANFYTYPIDPLNREPKVARQITTTPGAKVSLNIAPDGREFFYLGNGTVQSAAIDGSRAPRPVAIAAEMQVDFHKEKLEVFREAWTYLRDFFAFPTMNGVNWDGVRETYSPLVAAAATPDELRRLLQLMIGELNASHLGASAPAPAANAAAPPVTTGRTGLRFDAAALARSSSFTVKEVIPGSPAAIAGIKPGDTLQAIDGASLNAGANLEARLENTTGKQVRVKLADREVSLQPISTAAERDLGYKAWVDANREYVAKASGGRLGYVHMQNMNDTSVERLVEDLDSDNMQKQAVVIDMRANSGGFAAASALDIFERKPYITINRRGAGLVSIRTFAGQRSLRKPTILVTDRHTLSDGEDFTEGYRTLKMGKVIGEPTAGWFIGVGNIDLIDGTVFRVPTMQGFATNGENMEMHPRPVDIPVARPLGEGPAKDSQLDAAVRELLAQLDKK